MGHKRVKREKKKNDSQSKMIITKRKTKYKREKKEQWDLNKEQHESETK